MNTIQAVRPARAASQVARHLINTQLTQQDRAVECDRNQERLKCEELKERKAQYKSNYRKRPEVQQRLHEEWQQRAEQCNNNRKDKH